MATIPVSDTTRKEDERLREELANADLGKFKRIIKSILKPAKKKSGTNGRKRNID